MVSSVFTPGACAGEVGPEAELCNGDDDNCNGTSDELYGTPLEVSLGVGGLMDNAWAWLLKKEKGEIDEAEQQRQHARASLERYMHYWQRWAENDKARKTALKQVRRGRQRCWSRRRESAGGAGRGVGGGCVCAATKWTG